MADSFTQVPPDSTGDKIDTEQLTVGANTVERQRIQISGASALDLATVDATAGLKVDLGADNDVAVSSIAAGTNNIGDVDVASIAAGDNNIGNVDVLTVITGTAATNLGKATDAVAGASDVGVASLAVREDALGGLTPIAGDYAQLRVDANGALWVIPNGTTTVDNGGAFAVQVDAALPAGANTIGGVNVVAALPVGANTIGGVNVVAALPAGTNNIGDVDVLTLPAIPAGANTIGGVNVINALPAGTNNIGDVDVLTLPALVTGSAKIGSALISGTHVWDNTAGGAAEVEVKFASVDVAASGDNTIVAIVAGKEIRVISYVLVASGGANTLQWKSAAATNLSGGMGLADTGGISADSATGLFATTAGEALVLNLSAATSVDGHISYIEVD